MKAERFIYLLAFVALSGGACLLGSDTVYAHCDALNGPVVQDARLALDKGDITPVLKWVKKVNETEIRTAFSTAVAERSKSAEGKEKADMKFFETLVRIHRAGEGAAFTGLKPAGAIEPIIAEADKALEAGSADDLIAAMSNHLSEGVKGRLTRAIEKKKHVNDSVEAGREYVEAYVEYIHYVENLHDLVVGKGGHQQEESEATEHKGHDKE